MRSSVCGSNSSAYHSSMCAHTKESARSCAGLPAALSAALSSSSCSGGRSRTPSRTRALRSSLLIGLPLQGSSGSPSWRYSSRGK